MEKIELDDFLTDGILKEKDFRVKVDKIDWSIYKNKKVLIKGCTTAPVPTWSYLIITAKLSQNAKQILFGEPCSSVKIFTKSENQISN